ncbi:uncharacterized protein BO97DRAFT_406451 [Aspergillus homomorphus CBS 101889]|uniref:Uncharacterized protein n=1 Tax=Aspergillus homomorphus (strain CBS 101889) TaxID=1450537 RepID=A0A395HUQ2_ASPHC|nr:hypothetical protein BO97DRAFT_406451 [Aspergillus homomorphus CBS 101889]RAL11249.1 hypothetical protein BO97DRAFT_406451 [Aspergillus homomorphus CBS 101889]
MMTIRVVKRGWAEQGSRSSEERFPDQQPHIVMRAIGSVPVLWPVETCPTPSFHRHAANLQSVFLAHRKQMITVGKEHRLAVRARTTSNNTIVAICSVPFVLPHRTERSRTMLKRLKTQKSAKGASLYRCILSTKIQSAFPGDRTRQATSKHPHTSPGAVCEDAILGCQLTRMLTRLVCSRSSFHLLPNFESRMADSYPRS